MEEQLRVSPLRSSAVADKLRRDGNLFSGVGGDESRRSVVLQNDADPVQTTLRGLRGADEDWQFEGSGTPDVGSSHGF